MGGPLSTGLRLALAEAPTEADYAAILGPLAAFNGEHAERGCVSSLAILLKDAEDNTVGGLWARTLFSWLRIELVFVPQSMRRSSLGRSMVSEAEAVGRQRGCIGASLETYSFQARGFYEKLGYTLVGAIEDCPPGGARNFMQKRFAPAE